MFATGLPDGWDTRESKRRPTVVYAVELLSQLSSVVVVEGLELRSLCRRRWGIAAEEPDYGP